MLLVEVATELYQGLRNRDIYSRCRWECSKVTVIYEDCVQWEILPFRRKNSAIMAEVRKPLLAVFFVFEFVFKITLAHTHMEVGEKLTGSKFFSSTMWDPGIELRFSGLAASTFIH